MSRSIVVCMYVCSTILVLPRGPPESELHHALPCPLPALATLLTGHHLMPSSAESLLPQAQKMKADASVDTPAIWSLQQTGLNGLMPFPNRSNCKMLLFITCPLRCKNTSSFYLTLHCLHLTPHSHQGQRQQIMSGSSRDHTNALCVQYTLLVEL